MKRRRRQTASYELARMAPGPPTRAGRPQRTQRMTDSRKVAAVPLETLARKAAGWGPNQEASPGRVVDSRANSRLHEGLRSSSSPTRNPSRASSR